MLSPRIAAFAFIPLMSMSMSAVISLVFTMLQAGWSEGWAMLWLRSWGLSFAIALPTAWLLVPAIQKLLAWLTQAHTVPRQGVKIP